MHAKHLSKLHENSLAEVQTEQEKYEVELRKLKVHVAYLEGKVKELMDISGKQKKLLLSQESTVPFKILESEIQAQREALRHLRAYLLQLQGEQSWFHYSLLPSACNESKKLTSEAFKTAFAPHNQNHHAWDVFQDPHKANSWIRDAHLLMADAKVVDISKPNVHDAQKESEEALLKLNGMLLRGKCIRDRMCARIAEFSCNFDAFHNFLPPILVKQMAELQCAHQNRLVGRITIESDQTQNDSPQLHQLVVGDAELRKIHEFVF